MLFEKNCRAFSKVLPVLVLVIVVVSGSLIYSWSSGYIGSSTEEPSHTNDQSDDKNGSSDYPNETTHDDPAFDHFEFDLIDDPQTSGVPFTVTIKAVDQYGEQFVDYVGVNNLFCSGGTISPTATGSFFNGVWSGEVTVTGSVSDAVITTSAQSDSGWTGTSNTFNVDVVVEPILAMWNKTYGRTSRDERAYSLVVTGDGGYLMSGTSESPLGGSESVLLVKTDANGNLEWNRTVEGGACGSLVVTPDGGYALVGTLSERVRIDIDVYTYEYDAQLVKLDASGNVLWNQTYGGYGSDTARSLVVTDDGGFAIGGETSSFMLGGQHAWLIKTDENGTAQWNKTYGAGHNTFLVKLPDDGYALAYSSDDGDVLLVKTDADGTLQWSKPCGTQEWDSIQSFIATSDHGYALAGDTPFIGSGVDGTWFVKADELGNVVWNKTYEGSDLDSVSALIETSDGGYLIAGRTGVVDDYDLWLIKTTSNGTVEWTQTYGGAGDEQVFALVETPYGGYALAGYFRAPNTEEDVLYWGSVGNTDDFWLIKTDEYGNTN